MPEVTTAPKVLVLTGGHSFDRRAFGELLDSLPADVTWVEQPDAQKWLTPERLQGYAASLHYDMPGVFPEATPPPPEMVEGVAELTRTGHGFVVLHHAIAAWPTWDGWAELVGGRYHYRPGTLRGRRWPDSGYRFEVSQHLSPALAGHPVLDGLDDGLDVVDETYLCPVFEEDVVPLLRTDAPIDDSVHWSTVEAKAGRRESRANGWSHPPGSTLAAWARREQASRVVYIQPGDGAATFANTGYRRLVGNALRWVARQG